MSSSKPHSTKQPRNLEIVVHQRETPFVGLRAHLRERGFLIPPVLPRASWEPPAAHYPLHDPSDESLSGDAEVVMETLPPAASPRRPAFSLPTSLPSSAPPAPALPPPPAPPQMLPPLAAKPASVPAMPAMSAPRPPSMTMQSLKPPPPPPRMPSSPEIPSMHSMPTAGYDSSFALAGVSSASQSPEPPTAEFKFKDAEALLQKARGPGAMPVDDSPRTSRAEQHSVQLDLSEWGFHLALSFISQSNDNTPIELIRALRSELGHYLAHEVDQPHLLAQDRAYMRQAEQRILRFFNARMPQYPVVTADLSAVGP